MQVKVIAEAELNHNGDVDSAKKMVEAARKSGADFIKFQCFVTESFIVPASPQFQTFKSNELDLAQFREISDHARETGIEMIATAIDPEGLQMIVDLDLPIIKIDSTNITNVYFLGAVAETKKPVYLSTGASTLGDIEQALDVLGQGISDITLLHCTVQYPAEDENLNLRAITTMQAAFPGIPVGYSDHSVGPTAAVAAVALGATVLEKHFTLDNNLPGPDHGFSTNPEDFADYVGSVRTVVRMLGTGRKTPTEAEKRPLFRARRHLTAFCDIPVGAIIEPDMVRPRRVDFTQADPKSLLGAEYKETIHGWVAVRPLANGAAITLADVRPPD